MEEPPTHELHFPLDPNESWFHRHEFEILAILGITTAVIVVSSIFLANAVLIYFVMQIPQDTTTVISLLLLFGVVMKILWGEGWIKTDTCVLILTVGVIFATLILGQVLMSRFGEFHTAIFLGETEIIVGMSVYFIMHDLVGWNGVEEVD